MGTTPAAEETMMLLCTEHNTTHTGSQKLVHVKYISVAHYLISNAVSAAEKL